MREKTKKATFNIRTDVLDQLDEVMAQGMAPSKNALVEQAIIKELKELKKQERKTLWREAAADPLFVRDVQAVESDFKYADILTAQAIPFRSPVARRCSRPAADFDHHGPPGQDNLTAQAGQVDGLFE